MKKLNVSESDQEEGRNPLGAMDELIDAKITERINMFHDALVDRGQIKLIPPKEEWPIHKN